MKLKLLVFATLLAVVSNTFVHSDTKNMFSLEEVLSNNGFTKIPYSRLSSHHAIVGVSIKGKFGYFILDTGAGATVIHKNSVPKYDLEIVENSNAVGVGAGGKQDINQYSLSSFEIEGIDIDLDTIYAMDLSSVVNALNSLSESEIDGVIGQDILGSRNAIIDVASNTLYIK